MFDWLIWLTGLAAGIEYLSSGSVAAAVLLIVIVVIQAVRVWRGWRQLRY
jgi:hypothetical protein